MIRHSFIAEVAKIGIEEAILESEVSYCAENYGMEVNGVTDVRIPISKLKKKFSYFNRNIQEISESLSLNARFIYCEISEDGKYLDCEVVDSWLEQRKA